MDWMETNHVVEVPESAIKYDSAVGTWLPHRLGRAVTCKLWKILPCNFHFFFNGRIMVGPGKPLWIYLVFLHTGVTISFVVFDVLPFYRKWPDLIIGLIVIFMACTAIYNVFRIVFTDPGYMLPNWFSNQNSWLTKEIALKDIYKIYGYTSYCSICKIFQFPDTYHCYECHACIDGGDHHCQMLGTCVGKRNYRSFYIFAVTTNVAFWIGFVMSITHLVENWIAHGALFALARGITLYLILTTIILPPLGMYVMVMLPIAHTRLIYRGVTLNQEDLYETLWLLHKLSAKEKLVRFFHNFHERIIKPPPPSQIPYRILQLNVRIPAIPRTKLVNAHHHGLQRKYAMPRMRLVLKCAFLNTRFYDFRMRIVHKDIDAFRPLVTSIEYLGRMDVQKHFTAKNHPPNYNPPFHVLFRHHSISPLPSEMVDLFGREGSKVEEPNKSDQKAGTIV